MLHMLSASYIQNKFDIHIYIHILYSYVKVHLYTSICTNIYTYHVYLYIVYRLYSSIFGGFPSHGGPPKSHLSLDAASEAGGVGRHFAAQAEQQPALGMDWEDRKSIENP